MIIFGSNTWPSGSLLLLWGQKCSSACIKCYLKIKIQYFMFKLEHLLCISTSERMLKHAFTFWKQLKTLENHEKLLFSLCAQEAHVRLMFFIVLDHANACASMHSLFEIHNKHSLKIENFYWILLLCSPHSSRLGNTNMPFRAGLTYSQYFQ